MKTTEQQYDSLTNYYALTDWESEEQVREYFTVENLRAIYGSELTESQEELNDIADWVIAQLVF